MIEPDVQTKIWQMPNPLRLKYRGPVLHLIFSIVITVQLNVYW